MTGPLILGLDGIPIGLVRDLSDRGVFTWPRLLGGEVLQIRSSVPDVSSVAWASFSTGANPGEHGIFGFTDLRAGTYTMYAATSGDVRAPTLWDLAGARGLRGAILNVPGTYPAREVAGILVAGFVAPNIERAVWPPELVARLDGYVTDADVSPGRRDPDAFFRNLFAALLARTEAFHRLLADPYEYAVAVVTETDRLYHYFWDAVADRTHPLHGRTLEFHAALDRWMVASIERARGNVLVLSDHGFGALEREVYLNPWLAEEGWLAWTRTPPEGIGDLSGGSRAFAMDPGRIYIHARGRYPRGSVPPDDVPAVCDEIAQALLAWEIEGRRVARAVVRGRDAYRGPHAPHGPDLVVVANRGFDVRAGLRKTASWGRGDLVGRHTEDDAMAWMPTGLSPARPASVEAVGRAAWSLVEHARRVQ